MPSRRSAIDIGVVVLACSVALGAAGCAHERVHAAVPVAAPPLALSPETDHPMTIAPDTDAAARSSGFASNDSPSGNTP
jgi:hypothetical protein